jgi:hypothetical protein
LREKRQGSGVLMNKKVKPCEECSYGTGADVLYWQAAINSWHEYGNKQPIIEGLRFQRPIPPFARDFIADFLEGKLKRKPTLKKNRDITRNLFIKSGYRSLCITFKEAKRKGLLKHGETPADLAIAELADIYGLSESTIRGILFR